MNQDNPPHLTSAADLSSADLERLASDACAVANADVRDAHAQRHASALLVTLSRPASALPYAERACDLENENAGHWLHLGIVLNQNSAWRPAIEALMKSLARDRRVAETYYQLAYAAEQLGGFPTAAALALESMRIEPSNKHRRKYAAHLLACCDRTDQAVALLVDNSDRDDPDVTFLRSDILSRAGRLAEALDEVDLAILRAPDDATFHVHRSFLCYRLGLLDEAARSAHVAVSFDPGNARLVRHAAGMHHQSGNRLDALRSAGRLLALEPEFPETHHFLQHLLAEARQGRDDPARGSIAALKGRGSAQPRQRRADWRTALGTQANVLLALTLRDIRGRYAESRLGFVWAIAEVFLHVGVLAIVFQYTIHGRPPIGDDFFFFYFTGVMPYLLVSHLILHVGGSVRDQRYLLSVAAVKPLDLALSKSIVEMFTTAVIFVVFLALFALGGRNPLPASPMAVLLGFGAAWALGLGLGTACTALFLLGPVAEAVVGLLIRLLYFCSGIFYVPAAMPVWVRDVIVFNPFLHVVDLLRSGFFASYAPHWLDVGYLMECCLLALALGFTSLHVSRTKMRMPA